MQALWSRAAQTRSSCRCKACLHAATGISRRTTTAASRRRLKIGDLFTACYSTILGTAAFADAKAKEERRKQWEQAIADAKAEIPMGDSERAQRVLPDQLQKNDLCALISPIISYHKVSTRKIQHEDLQTTLDLHLTQALESSHKTLELSRLPNSESDRSDAVDPEDLKFALRKPATRVHLDKMEVMISKLVTRMLVRRDFLIPEKVVSHHETAQQMREIASRLESLRGINTRLPSYTFPDLETSKQEHWQLNNALEALFRHTPADGSNLNVIIAKMCYNLLISSSPPSIQTYDILIRSLTQMKLHGLTQVVVDSFLWESKFTPTSTTVQLILDHYRMRKDAAGFRAIINRMRAVDGDLRIKKRTIESLCKPKEQEWALTSKVLQKGGYLREKVSRDSDIFNSLINGCLEFDKLRSAIRYFRAALREGVHVSSETLCRIVMDCAKVLDFKAGLLVLQALLRHWDGRLSSEIPYSRSTRWAVRRLTCLCGIEPALNVTTPLPGNISRAAMVNLQRHLVIASLEEKLHNISTHIASLDAMLAHVANTSGDTRTAYIRKTFSMLHKASALERVQILRSEKHYQEEAALRKARMGDEKDWVATQYRKLSAMGKKQYDVVIKSNPTLPCIERLEIISIYREGSRVSAKHRLFPMLSSAKNSASKQQVMDSTTVGMIAKVEEQPANEMISKSPIRSPPKRPLKCPSSLISPRSFTFPEVTPTLAMVLPLSPIHNDVGIEVAAR